VPTARKDASGRSTEDHPGYLRRPVVCLAQELSPVEQRLGTVEPFMKLLLEASTELLNASTVAVLCTYVIHNTEREKCPRTRGHFLFPH